MRPLLFAANWKMHLGPDAARAFMDAWLAGWNRPDDGREVWFFPPALSVTAVHAAIRGREGLRVGVQNVHWEGKGAFTGETSVPMSVEAGAMSALVGHSERRHVFGETDEMCSRKVRAALAGTLVPVLCVGERIEEREEGRTLDVVRRQLAVLEGIPRADLNRVVVAYEPVWAIGTGRNATPDDAAAVHADIRQTLRTLGADADGTRILYGGSVKPGNVRDLLAASDVDGVLVGGASLDPGQWGAITAAGRD